MAVLAEELQDNAGSPIRREPARIDGDPIGVDPNVTPCRAARVAFNPQRVNLPVAADGAVQYRQHRIDCPNVVRTIGIDPWHDPPYLVTEYVDGQTLRELLSEGVPLAVESVLRCVRQILTALKAAHAAGVVHRDLKPENILIEGGTARVTDFGLGHLEEATSRSVMASGSLQTMTGASLVGTLDYMAPEQRGGGAVDHRADMYALGAMLFEMLTGTRPTGGDAASDLRAGVPKYLDCIYRQCHCHVKHRMASAAAVLGAIEAGLDEGKRTPQTPARVSKASVEPPPDVQGVRAVLGGFASMSGRDRAGREPHRHPSNPDPGLHRSPQPYPRVQSRRVPRRLTLS